MTATRDIDARRAVADALPVRRLADAVARAAHALRALLLAEPAAHLAEERARFAAAWGPARTSPAAFADAYAQAVCYALVAARCLDAPAGRAALADLPVSEPALRAMVARAGAPALDPRVARRLDALAEEIAPAGDAVRALGARPGDAIGRFYEPFLAAYDARERASRGVYYTPSEVVAYVVASADEALRATLGWDAGLCDPRAVVLDPAAGTGAFLRGVLDHVRARGVAVEDARARLVGFEVLPGAFAAAHVCMGVHAIAGGAGSARARVYLADALASPDARGDGSEGARAVRARHDEPIAVVLGNPPYRGRSASAGAWGAELLRGRGDGAQGGSYFEAGGAPLGEKNPKWLNDDYVKFVRMAQWRVERTGHGVVAFVCNHGFVDHPTFRGMRERLREAFDEVRVLDLHGNATKRERAPGGGRDENVFAARQGVAVVLLARRPGARGGRAGRVFYAERWGARDGAGGKLAWLAANHAGTTAWTEVAAGGDPVGAFVPRAASAGDDGVRVTEAMPVHSVAVVTARDALVLDVDEAALRARLAAIVAPGGEAELARWLAPRDRLDARAAAQALRDDPGVARAVVPCLYRPFDVRALLYHDAVVGRSRRAVMRHLLAGDNVALVTRRRMLPGHACTYVFAARHVVSDGAIRSDNFGSEAVFPLYVRDDADDDDDADDARGAAAEARRANLAACFTDPIAARTGLAYDPSRPRGDLARAFGPRDAFDYAYAVLHATAWRARHAALGASDFPRVPAPASLASFRALARAGGALVDLHTLARAPSRQARFPVPGDAVVREARYEPPCGAHAGRVWINASQYFEGVPADAWGYLVGPYAVCRKWLRDRARRALTRDEVARYGAVVGALADSAELVRAVDAAYSG